MKSKPNIFGVMKEQQPKTFRTTDDPTKHALPNRVLYFFWMRIGMSPKDEAVWRAVDGLMHRSK